MIIKMIKREVKKFYRNNNRPNSPNIVENKGYIKLSICPTLPFPTRVVFPRRMEVTWSLYKNRVQERGTFGNFAHFACSQV